MNFARVEALINISKVVLNDIKRQIDGRVSDCSDISVPPTLLTLGAPKIGLQRSPAATRRALRCMLLPYKKTLYRKRVIQEVPRIRGRVP